MLEEKQNQNIDTNMNSNQKVFDNLNTEKELEVNDDNIHYMPERFMTPSEIKHGKKNIGLTILIIVIILVVLGVAGFAVYVLYGKRVPTNNNSFDLGQVPTTTQEVVDPNKTEDLVTPELRDQKRLSDILEIRTALSLYFNEQGKYPNSLFDLSSYLTNIPINPLPNGESYNYQVKDSNKDYIVTFAFEGSIKNGNLILQPGKYQLSSTFGIEVYKEPQDDTEDNDDDDNDDNDDNNDNDNDQQPAIIPPYGIDSDGDGLTDIEELIFKTNSGLKDTDSDTYNDKEELINLYDPTKIDAKLLDDVSLARVFIQEDLKYSFVYPASWVSQTKDAQSQDVIVFETQDKDFIKIQFKQNPQELSAKNWYLNGSPDVSASDLSDYKNQNNIIGIRSKDNLNVYLGVGTKIYIISYISINTEKLNYPSILDLIANSFKVWE